MSLRIYTDLQQGTPEWIEARRGLITASTVGQLITARTLKPAANPASRGLALTLIAERITGHVEPTFQSADMLRGVLEEPLARKAYTEWTGVEVQQLGFMTETFDGATLGYSPDGLVGHDGLIEIKSRAPRKHLETILSGGVPAENMAQLQAGLLVSGRTWIDYVSYCGGMPLYVKRVRPDARWQEAIIAALHEFEDSVATVLHTYYARTDDMPVMERTNLEEELTF